MVVLNRIYTKTGDGGQTRLASGATVSKSNPRVEAYGAVDELNAVIGVARQHYKDGPEARSRSNKLMRLRVLLQAVAVVLLVAGMWWKSTHGA